MITDLEAVAFCNNRVRRVADKIAQAYYLALEVKQEWYANPNLGNVLTGQDIVADGSATDGRHPITGERAMFIIQRCETLIDELEANNRAHLTDILATAVNVNP